MAWWIYKCNTKKRYRAFGDWETFFQNPHSSWGSSKWTPDLKRLKRGDFVIAYQTNRNELVGLTRVRQSCDSSKRGYLYLDAIEIIRVRVRPLKKIYPKIASIPALQPGPIKTIYKISDQDAYRLLKAAGSNYGVKFDSISRENTRDRKQNLPLWVDGGGFGSPENNAVVEKKAIALVMKKYRKQGWQVESVEQENCGFDLRCKKYKKILEVEVEGVTGETEAFIITAGEVRRIKARDTRYCKFELCVVTAVLSGEPRVSTFSRREVLKEFIFDPIQFRVIPR